MSQAFKVDLFSCSIISGLPDFKDSAIQLYAYNIIGYFLIFIFTKVPRASNLQITSLMKCNVKKYNFNDINRIIMYTSMVIVNPSFSV